MNNDSFWESRGHSEEVLSELKELKNQVLMIETFEKNIKDSKEFVELSEEDQSIKNLLEDQIANLQTEYEKLEIFILLNGEYDKCNCILEIHPGAGGTESCDWALMLYRMYTRWCEKNGYKFEILDYQDGEEAGIKSVSVLIKGEYAYGYLKNEKGIHRLVRLSPFDSNHRRHTSFASIDITPETEAKSDIEINENDLKIDVYRSSGAGGQHVNTTDSAVRITHLPTKIVVTCQNGRSQIQNKQKAIEILKTKLQLLKEEEENNEKLQLKGEQKNIDFGFQIRSYVLHPYSLVKDHRTNTETSNVNKVLDGDINEFINSNLRRG